MKTKKLKLLFTAFVMFLLCKVGISQTTQIPHFTSGAEREAWVKAHPKEYNASLDSTSVNVDQSATTEAKTTQPSTEPGFPQYLNTGDKEKDDANYAAAKAAWIAQNPEKYAEMTGQPK